MCWTRLLVTSQTIICQQCLVGTAGFALGKEDGLDDILMSFAAPVFSLCA